MGKNEGIGGMRVKEDCFACRKSSKGTFFCVILKKNICEKRECSFYKTYEEYVKGYKDYPGYEDICRAHGVEPKDEIS